jgi:hypothetical protein
VSTTRITYVRILAAWSINRRVCLEPRRHLHSAGPHHPDSHCQLSSSNRARRRDQTTCETCGHLEPERAGVQVKTLRITLISEQPRSGRHESDSLLPCRIFPDLKKNYQKQPWSVLQVCVCVCDEVSSQIQVCQEPSSGSVWAARVRLRLGHASLTNEIGLFFHTDRNPFIQLYGPDMQIFLRPT